MQKPDDIVRVRHMLDFARKAVRFNKGKNRADLDSNEMLAIALIKSSYQKLQKHTLKLPEPLIYLFGSSIIFVKVETDKY